MRISSLLGAAAAASLALLILALGSVRCSVQDLHDRFDRSESALAGVRSDVDRLRRENSAAMPAAPAPAPRDPALLQHDILGPSVQVNVQGSVGGGTLLFSRETHTYVVTACHVIQKLLHSGDDDETRAPAEITIYDDQGRSADVLDADLVAWDEHKDLALFRLRCVHELPNVAHLASRETLRSIRVFTPIYAVGCPLGHDPLPTLGEIATLNKEVNGERFWMMNAPTIFGNSGGGVFHRETRELIGVSVMVCTYDGAVSTPVPHLGIMVSLETVYDWLDALNYQFVYDPSFPLEGSEALRGTSAKRPAGDASGAPAASPTSANR